MPRLWQLLLIVATLGVSWHGMLLLHELGHVANGLLSGGSLRRMVLPPLGISRTDIEPNPSPRFVAWGGAIWGSALPLAAWLLALQIMPGHAYLARFFAGFCLIANGAYLAIGWVGEIGDAGDLLRYGAQPWQLVLFGGPAIAAGLWLWNGLGPYFGLAQKGGDVDRRAAGAVSAAWGLLIAAQVLAERLGLIEF